MTEENEIELTDDEILMIRSFCQGTLASEPQNAALATSILAKLSGVESSEIFIEQQSTKTKRGRPRRTPVELIKEVIAKPEPESIEVTSETPVLIEEQVQEPQPLAASDNIELTKTVTEQPIITVASNPKLNFLQHFLQKLQLVIHP